jgi:integrase
MSGPLPGWYDEAYEAWLGGALYVELAARYGVTPERIKQVVRERQAAAALVPIGAGHPAELERLPQPAAETPPPPGSPQHVIDNWLPPSEQFKILRGKADNTIRMYVRAFGWWTRWATEHHVTVMPAPQNAMCRFLSYWDTFPVHVGCSGRHQADGTACTGHRPSPSALWIWYSALKWFHGIGDPPVPWEGGVRLSDRMATYVKDIKDDGWRADKSPRAYKPELRLMVDAVREAPSTVLAPARRDMIVALVLANYYTGGRASDLARYRIGDVDHFPGGIELTLARSKAKQADRDEEKRTIHRDLENPQYDGVDAVDQWVDRMRDNGITSGALFRPVHKSGVIVRGAPDQLKYMMDVTGLTRTVRLAAKLAWEKSGRTMLKNWAKVTCHSLRRGRLQDLLEGGADLWDVEEELGWAHGGASKFYRAEVKRQSPDAANAKGML